jgi:hypothetical protein
MNWMHVLLVLVFSLLVLFFMLAMAGLLARGAETRFYRSRASVWNRYDDYCRRCAENGGQKPVTFEKFVERMEWE